MVDQCGVLIQKFRLDLFFEGELVERVALFRQIADSPDEGEAALDQRQLGGRVVALHQVPHSGEEHEEKHHHRENYVLDLA